MINGFSKGLVPDFSKETKLVIGVPSPATTFGGLRTVFTVERPVNSMSKASITVYNMSRKRCDSIQFGDPISLMVGADLVFSGFVLSVSQAMNGSDFVVSVSASDVVTLENYSRSYNFSFDKMTKGSSVFSLLKTIVKRTAPTLTLTTTQAADALIEAKVFKSGYTISGKSWAESIMSVANSFSMSFSITDTEVRFRSKAEPADPVLTHVVSAKTGNLVGTPSVKGYVDGKTKHPFKVIDFSMTMDTSVSFGDSVTVMAQDYSLSGSTFGSSRIRSASGTYTVQGVVHTGDTHGTQWTTQVHGFTKEVV